MEKYNILLVEDDPALGYVLTEYLGMKELDVSWAKTGKEALQQVEKRSFHLAVLDVMMPDMDGFELAGELNKSHPELPFIFLTARAMKVDVLKGFSLGAVDYLKKPIDEEELVVRIRTLLSRLVGADDLKIHHSFYGIGEYTLNYQNLELLYKNEKRQLTNRENELLRYLIIHKNNVCSHKEILTEIWGENNYFNRKSLNVFISHLRKYLSKDPGISIENVHNKGFILKAD